MKEIVDLTTGDFDVQFPEELDIQCDYGVESIRDALNRLLGDKSCDMVLALGVIATNEVCHMGPLPKPVVAPFVIDTELQDTPSDGPSSGVKNLSYLTSPFNLRRDVKAFMSYTEFDTLAVLSSRPYVEAIPQLSEKLQKATSATGVTTIVIRVGDSPSAALDAIPPGTDAVFISGLTHLPYDSLQVIIDGVNERKLPSFSMMGRMDVERGVLYGLSPESTFPRFARRVALHVQQILLGVEPGTLPVAFSGGERLTVNMETARKIGIFPNWEVITEADLVGLAERKVAATWGMRSVMDEALRVNRDLAVSERAVRAGAQDVNRSISTLLPQIDLSGNAIAIDEDRARSGLGASPERSGTIRVEGSQLIWSQRAWADYSIQKNVQRSREEEYETTRLDVALDALTAYLDVLRAKTAERIVLRNLELSRSNLELARTRRSVGVANPGEVYRWETALANSRANAINANALRNLAEIELNRVLYRPLEQPFATEDVGMNDPDVMRYQRDVLTYADNPYSFKVLRNFLVEDGLKISPELKALDAAIAAQKRAYDSTTYDFFSPDVLLFGVVDHTLWRDGAGSDQIAIDGFPSQDDTRWTVGLEFNFPLITSGERVFNRRRASEELGRLKTERESLAQRIEQRIRSSLHEMGAAYANIRQTRLAADAAQKNLELIVQEYSMGTVSILNLLDAQASTFSAELQANDAVYDFLIKLMRVERSIGQFYFFAPQEVVDAIGERFDRYLETHPITY
jgi:outer membrane protein TolC